MANLISTIAAMNDRDALYLRSGVLCDMLAFSQRRPSEKLAMANRQILRLAMIQSVTAGRLAATGTPTCETAGLLGWTEKKVSSILSRTARHLGRLEPFVKSQDDRCMLAAAAAVRLSPGPGFNLLIDRFGAQLADLARLRDAIADGLLQPAATSPKRGLKGVTEGQVRVILALAGRTSLDPVEVRDIARGELRKKIDEGRVAFIDAKKFRIGDRVVWAVALRVGSGGITSILLGPESGRTVQALITNFLRQHGHTFDVLVTDCALAYQELSVATLLMHMGVELYQTEFVVDNWIEREFARLNWRVLREAHRDESTFAPHLERLTKPLTSSDKGRLRKLNPAQVGLLRYDRYRQADVVDGGADVFGIFIPAERRDGTQVTLGLDFSNKADLDATQTVRADVLMVALELQASENHAMGRGAVSVQVLGGHDVRVAGRRHSTGKVRKGRTRPVVIEGLAFCREETTARLRHPSPIERRAAGLKPASARSTSARMGSSSSCGSRRGRTSRRSSRTTE